MAKEGSINNMETSLSITWSRNHFQTGTWWKRMVRWNQVSKSVTLTTMTVEASRKHQQLNDLSVTSLLFLRKQGVIVCMSQSLVPTSFPFKTLSSKKSPHFWRTWFLVVPAWDPYRDAWESPIVMYDSVWLPWCPIWATGLGEVITENWLPSKVTELWDINIF